MRIAVVFVDGLDHGFLTRNLGDEPRLRRLFAPERIWRVQGVVHSILCTAQVFAGRHLDDRYEFEGLSQLPRTDRLVNWDALLQWVPESSLLWRRLNDAGWRVGLFEPLGVFLPPRLDGFVVTKNLRLLGLGGLYAAGLSHYPEQVGQRYRRLCGEHGYTPGPRAVVDSFSDYLSTSELSACSPSRVQEVLRVCGYRRILDAAETRVRHVLAVASGLVAEEPVDLFFMHTGVFDSLLHVYLGRSEERRIAKILADLVCGVRDALEAEEILVFSDHGMAPNRPHDNGAGFIHLTRHERRSAVIMGAGPTVEARLEAHPPADLTAVYDTVVAVAGLPEQPRDALAPDVALRQQELTVLDRERRMLELDRALALSLDREAALGRALALTTLAPPARPESPAEGAERRGGANGLQTLLGRMLRRWRPG